MKFGTSVALLVGVMSGADHMTVEADRVEVEGRSVVTSEREQVPDPERSGASTDDALRLAELSAPEQRRYLRKHSDLCNPQVVISFCRRAAGLLRIGLLLHAVPTGRYLVIRE